MSLDENKAIVRRLIEIFNSHNLTSLHEFMAPNVVIDQTLQGLESFKQFETLFIQAFPDYQEIIEDIIAEGDKVWVHFKVTGTHTGNWAVLGMTLPPTNRTISYTGVSMWRIVDGKVVERTSVRDMLDFFRQLDLIDYTDVVTTLFS